ISPRIVTFSPAIFPLCSRIVNASSNACVGCSCAPSPALMMLALTTRDRKCGAPDALWRMTMKSALSASRLRAVSLSVSPFLNDEASAEKFAMSAVNQHDELDFFWPAKIVERIHRGARRAAGEQHVVHQHHGFTGHIE